MSDQKTNEDLQKEIEELEKTEEEKENLEASTEKELQELNDKYLRLRAEFENYKRRSEEENLSSFGSGAKSILSVILPFFDNFKRAVDSCPKDIVSHDWVKGILSIEKDLFKELEKKGLKKLESKGGKFDLNTMEALMQDPELEKDLVSEVFEEAYEFNGQVVRHAKVKVGSKV